MASISVGSVSVDVVPSVSGFAREMRRRVLPEARTVGDEVGREMASRINSHLDNVRVRVEMGQARAQVATLNRLLDRVDGRRVRVDVDVAVAGSLAELRALAQLLDRFDGRRVNVRLDVDAAAAIARLLALQAQMSRLDGQTAHMNADMDIGGALASIATLRAAMAGLALAANPQFAALGAGLVGLIGPATAAGVGFAGMGAVAIPAINKIREAQQQETQAVRQGTAAAAQGQSNVYALANARQQLAAAVRNSAQAHRQALEQVRQAEVRVADAQRDARQAQVDLNRARQDARRQLEDLRNDVVSARLSVEESRLGIEDARASWQEMASAARKAAADVASAQTALSKAQEAQAKLADDPAATEAAKRSAQASVDSAAAALQAAKDKKTAADRDTAQAALNYRQAVQRLKEQQLQLRRLEQDERAASKAGVEGSDVVRQARDRLAAANRQVGESERALSAARANVARVDQQSADQVASARRALAQATAQAAAANRGLSGSMGGVAGKTVQLTALERQLQAAWQGLTGAFNEWATALQPEVLPVLIKGIGILRSLLPALTPIVVATARAVSGLLDQLAAGLRSPFFRQFAADLARWAGPAVTLFGQIVGNLLKAFAGIAQAFAPIGFAMLGLLNRVTAAFARFTTGLVNNPGFQQFAAQMIQVLNNMGAGFAQLMPLVAPIIGDLLKLLFNLGLVSQQIFRSVLVAILPTVGVLVRSLSQALTAILPIITSLLPVLSPVLSAIGTAVGQVVTALAAAVQQSAPALQQLVTAVASLIPELLPLVTLWARWLTTIIPLIPAVLQVAAVLAGVLVPVIRVVLRVLVGLWTTIGGLILPVMRLMVAAVTWVASVLEPAFQLIGRVATWLWKNVFGPAFRGIATLARWLYSIVAFSVMAPLIVIFKVVAGIATWLWRTVFVPAWRGIVAAHKQAWATIKPIVNALGAGIRWVWNTFVKPAFDGMRLAVGKLAPYFRSAVDAIRREWDKLKSAAKGPVSFVVNTVFNGGIVKIWDAVAKLVPGMKRLDPIRGFATGGVMPGYAPGKDKLLAAVSPGESIFRPEFTRAVGEKFVSGANSAARSGGVSGVVRYLGMAGDPGMGPGFAGHFAFGGIVGGFLKAAKGWFAKGLVKTATAAFNPLVASAQKAIGGTGFGDLAVNAVRGLTSRILSYFGPLEKKIGGGGSMGAVRAVRAVIGTPYSWGGGGPHGPSRGFGRGANTVGFDCSSLMQYGWYQAAHKVMPRTTYTQRPWLRRISQPVPGAVGQPHPGHTYMYSGAGKIIEAPFTGGFVREVPMRPTPFWGLPPFKFDQGGWLPTGTSLVYNGTRAPEPVLTTQQLERLASGESGGRSGPLMNVEKQYINEGADVDMLAHRLGFAARSSTFG